MYSLSLVLEESNKSMSVLHQIWWFFKPLLQENIALLEKGVDKMKVRTRQYARRQLKWINQRFLNGGGRPGDLPRVYKVDSSNYPQGWDEDCHNPAAKIVQSYIDGEAEVSGMEPIPINLKAHSYDDTRKMYTCELCNIQVSLTCGFKTNSYIKV